MLPTGYSSNSKGRNCAVNFSPPPTAPPALFQKLKKKYHHCFRNGYQGLKYNNSYS